MFSYATLKKLDYRDLVMLLREAQKKKLEDSLNLLSIVRSAMAKSADYALTVREFRNKINELQKPRREVLSENWSDLKKRG